MKFADLYKAEYNVWKVRAFPQSWQAGKTFYYKDSYRPDSGILLFRHGGAICHTPDGDLHIKCGDALFVGQDSAYSMTFVNETGEPVKDRMINFELTDHKGKVLDLKNQFAVIRDANLKADFKVCYRLARKADVLPAKLKTAITEMLFGMSELNGQAKRKSTSVDKAKEYISENYLSENIAVSYLAELCHMSDAHFRRVFKSETDFSPKEYISDLKIKRANLLLTYPDITVTEIAEDLGFSDVSYFIRFYKKHTGNSPGNIKKK
ncbi:MAG: helix-turn-helix transcriptional regulator [Clostridia bacterium]|nr:helix-turn-helix transcriptional regulator [Clostridia bacterium]